MTIILLISLMVFATFSVRMISICIFSGRVLSPLTHRALSLVPVSILSAICGPLVFRPEGNWENPLLLIEFWAAAASICLAKFGMLPAIAAGIGIYVVGKFLL